jgi:hypothetical protein
VKAFLVIAFAPLALSCSPANVGGLADGGDDGHEAGDAPDVVSACNDYAEAFCHRLQQCSLTVFQTHYGPNLATCVLLYSELCKNAFAASGSGATVATRAECTKAIPGWACADIEDLENQPGPCVVTGSLPDGAKCGVKEQCRSGYCGIISGAACGKCAQPALQGASCATTQCALGFDCMEGSCFGYGGTGEICGEGQPSCGFGLSCNMAMSPPFCAKPSGTKVGAPCSEAAACDYAAGLVCNAETGSCEMTHGVHSGDACGLVEGVEIYCIGGECVHGVCVANLLPGQRCDLGGPAVCIGASCVTADGGTHGTCEVRGSEPCR